MKTVYVHFKKDFQFNEDDMTRDNIVYGAEQNILAIDKVKEVQYDKDTITIIHNKNKSIIETKNVDKVVIN